MAKVQFINPCRPMLRSISLDEHSQKIVSLNIGMARELKTSNVPPRLYARCQSFPNQKCNMEKSLDGFMWRIDDESLYDLPPYYPLDRTHTIIQGTRASIVARRIVECLRRLSIAASFDHGKAKIKAETLDNVTLRIQLFRKYGSIIVEVSRREGCPMKFSHVQRAIIAAANGHEYRSNYLQIAATPTNFEEKQKTYFHRNIESIFCSLKNINDLLTNERLDARLLGMEYLKFMTDPSLTNHKISNVAAKMVLKGDDDIEFRNVVESFLMDWEKHTTSKFERNYFKMMHNHALAILSNCVSQMTCETLRGIVENDSWFVGVVKYLVTELKAKGRPHDAYQSAKCLKSLLRASDNIRCKAAEAGVHEALWVSLYMGRCGHELLEKESEHVMRLLGVRARRSG